MLMRVVAPHFVAGVVFDGETVASRVVRAAPIVHYMQGWTAARVMAYCRTKKWSVR